MPLDKAKRWLSDLLELLKEGGHWYVPRSRTTYFCSRKKKTLRRDGPGDKSIEYVAGELGWEIKDSQHDHAIPCSTEGG